MHVKFKCTKCQIYYNKDKKILSQIKKETGCKYIINGYLFDRKTFTPNGWLILNSLVVQSDKYNDWCLHVKDGIPLFDVVKDDDCISGIPILYNGKKIYRELTPDVARCAERTGIAWTKDGEIILWCDKQKLFREGLQDKLLSLGAYNALMLDGGGSTQGIFDNKALYSPRKVSTVLCFWDDEQVENKEETKVVSVNVYNKDKEGNTQVATNFKVKEFKSRTNKIVLIHHNLPVALQMIRDKIGKPIIITNAYRTEEHNTSVGGASNSYHLYGMAADIYVNGMTPNELAKVISNLFPTTFGVICYPKKGIVHFDVRSKKYRAINNGKETPVEQF